MEQRRKGEVEGKRLTPGERAVNWAKAGAIVIPLFGAGWFTNSETVKRLYAEESQDIEQVNEEAVVQDAPVAQAGIIERTIIREKDCGTSEAMKSHVKALH